MTEQAKTQAKSRSELYRFRAAELRRFAQGVADSVVRKEFLATAAGCEGMAKTLEAATAPVLPYRAALNDMPAGTQETADTDRKTA